MTYLLLARQVLAALFQADGAVEADLGATAETDTKVEQRPHVEGEGSGGSETTSTSGDDIDEELLELLYRRSGYEILPFKRRNVGALDFAFRYSATAPGSSR